jgi:hypothetical protein
LPLIPKVLKIFHFIDFPSPEITISMMHRTAQSISLTIFVLIKERSKVDDDQFMAAIFQVGGSGYHP